MKKYFGLLLLLLAQNICASELVQLPSKVLAELLPETYKKCQLVARYLDKYPNGKNEEEKKKIDLFFKNPSKECKILIYCIDQHKSDFNKFPLELKKVIFTNALYEDVSRFYARQNYIKFCLIRDENDKHDSRNGYSTISYLREIVPSKNNSQEYFLCEIIGFPDDEDSKKVLVESCCFKRRERAKDFLNSKKMRVAYYKQSFCEIVEKFSKQENVHEFAYFLRELRSRLNYYQTPLIVSLEYLLWRDSHFKMNEQSECSCVLV